MLFLHLIYFLRLKLSERSTYIHIFFFLMFSRLINARERARKKKEEEERRLEREKEKVYLLVVACFSKYAVMCIWMWIDVKALGELLSVKLFHVCFTYKLGKTCPSKKRWQNMNVSYVKRMIFGMESCHNIGLNILPTWPSLR